MLCYCDRCNKEWITLGAIDSPFKRICTTCIRSRVPLAMAELSESSLDAYRKEGMQVILNLAVAIDHAVNLYGLEGAEDRVNSMARDMTKNAPRVGLH